MSNDLIYMEGFDGVQSVGVIAESPLAEFPTGTSHLTMTSSWTQGTGRGLEVNGSSGPSDHNRGLRINAQDESEDLWAGLWFTARFSGLVHRLLVLYVDDVPVWAVLVDRDANEAFTMMPPDMNARAPANSSGAESVASVTSFASGDGQTCRVHVHREASDATVTVFWSGEPIMVDTVPALALGAGPIDVLFNGRLDTTTPGRETFFDDLWVAGSDYGDARIVVLKPEADGTYNDGVPSTGSDLHSILSQQLGVTSQHVGFSGGDKATFDLDTTPLDELSALNAAAIQVDVYMTGPSTLKAIHRLAGSDYDLGDLSQPGGSAARASLMLFTNPATGGSFLPSDFEGGEFGVQA